MSLGAAVNSLLDQLAADLKTAWGPELTVYKSHPKTLRGGRLPAAILRWEANRNDEAQTLRFDSYEVKVEVMYLEKEDVRTDWAAVAATRMDAIASVLLGSTYGGLILPSIDSFTLLEADEEAIVGLEFTLVGILSVARS